MKLIHVGYWSPESTTLSPYNDNLPFHVAASLPCAMDFVDESWDPKERELVAEYLDKGDKRASRRSDMYTPHGIVVYSAGYGGRKTLPWTREREVTLKNINKGMKVMRREFDITLGDRFAPFHTKGCGMVTRNDIGKTLVVDFYPNGDTIDALVDKPTLDPSDAANCTHREVDGKGNCKQCKVFVTAIPHMWNERSR